MKLLPVLIAEDDADLREALSATLQLNGYTVIEAIDGESALAALARDPVGLLISDVQMKPMDGHALLARARSEYPDVPVILMTAYGMIDKAVSAIRAGAVNYLTKPFEPGRLLEEVACHMRPAPSAPGRSRRPGTDGVVARDPATRGVLELARRVSATDATVLITGESGTGKEVFARFIHRHSGRAAAPFVAINCAAIPENLLEATLFGYEKGAFTGASQATAGKFEQAQGGTLLLDEISEMPLTLQAKLLRVLQEREVERVGGRRPVPLDIRVLATSNRDMAAEAQSGRFREDLYYRLNVFPIDLPPLRDRPLDILPLALEVVARFAPGRDVVLSPEAERSLTTHRWAGNIRELENVLQRALILAQGRVIEAGDLHLPVAPAAAGLAAGRQNLPTAVPAGPREAPGQDSAGADVPGGRPAPSSGPESLDMKSLERRHILEALSAAGGSRRKAAARLQMSERTLRYKLAQYRAAGWLDGAMQDDDEGPGG
ncbi:MAG: sigma-54 dependent transcriptional regulator [Burkholderiales bacterium]|nr:sigma-54 dependent transcriptional regulator [Burkholderiales bacterium]